MTIGFGHGKDNFPIILGLSSYDQTNSIELSAVCLFLRKNYSEECVLRGHQNKCT